METIEKLIGKKVKDARVRLGLSQSDLAKNAKTSLTTINRLEKGHQFPHLATLREVAKVLGISENDILDTRPPASEAISKAGLLTEIYTLAPSLQEDQLKEILTKIRSYSK
jgi:transcriptional regulator with XRE-family HTH domain